MNDTKSENSQQAPNDPTGEYLRWLTQSGLCAKLHSGQLALLMAFAKYADWRTGTAYPSISRLARELDLDRGHLYRLLNQLRSEHLIEVVGTVPTAHGHPVRKWKLTGFLEATALPCQKQQRSSARAEKATERIVSCSLPSAAPAHSEQEQEPEPKPEPHQTKVVDVVLEVNVENVVGSRQAEVHGLLTSAGIDGCVAAELSVLDREPGFVRSLVAESRGKRSPAGFIVAGMRRHFPLKQITQPPPVSKAKAPVATLFDVTQFTASSLQRIKERALLRVSPEERQKLAERPWTDAELNAVVQRYWQRQSEAA